MKKNVDVCVLGNAVVDGFARVSDDLLKELGIKKASVAHFDHEAFMRLNDQVMLEHFSAGGSAANVAAALAQLGANVTYLGRVGKDPAGEHFFTTLQETGAHMMPPDDTVRTFQVFVLLTPDGERTFVEGSITAPLTPGWFAQTRPSTYDWLVVEGYMLTDQEDAVKAAITHAHRFGRKVIFMVPPPSVIQRAPEAFDRIIEKGVDLIFSDKAEALYLESVLSQKSAQAWSKAARVETIGAEGVSYIEQGQAPLFMPCPEVLDVKDATGAGEGFASGFLYGLMQNESPEVCLGYGHQLAARVVQQMGARVTNLKPELLLKQDRLDV